MDSAMQNENSLISQFEEDVLADTARTTNDVLVLSSDFLKIEERDDREEEVLVEVCDLVQAIDDQRILQGVNLKVYRGETLVLLGKSGGGKSVFLRHLIGLMKPVSGQIIFDHQDITQLNERELEDVRKKIGMVFQDGALFDSLSVFDNVAFPLRERGVKSEEEIRQLVAQALARVNMTGHEEKMPVNLSGGMRKRVALARVIVQPPEVILYDEPTAGLDPIVSDSINRLIRQMQHDLKVTSVVVTHDMTSTYHIADRVALLHEGRIYFEGLVENLKTTQDPVIRDFIEGRSDESMLY